MPRGSRKQRLYRHSALFSVSHTGVHQGEENEHHFIRFVIKKFSFFVLYSCVKLVNDKALRTCIRTFCCFEQ